MAKTCFFWDELEDNIVEEFDDVGVTIADYTTEPAHFGNVISQQSSGESSFFHYDVLGSALAVTDETQDVTDTRAYSAFGETTESTGSTAIPFQYLGQLGYYFGPRPGLYYIRRRELRAPLARWMTKDPLGVSVPGHNVYQYARNCPVVNIDPSGLICVVCRWKPRLTDRIDPLDVGLVDPIHRWGIETWISGLNDDLQRIGNIIRRDNPGRAVKVPVLPHITAYGPFLLTITLDGIPFMAFTYAPFAIEATACGDTCNISLHEHTIRIHGDDTSETDKWPLEHAILGKGSDEIMNYMITGMDPAPLRGCNKVILVTDIPTTVQNIQDEVFMDKLVHASMYITDGALGAGGKSAYYKYDFAQGMLRQGPPWKAYFSLKWRGQRKLGRAEDCC